MAEGARVTDREYKWYKKNERIIAFKTTISVFFKVIIRISYRPLTKTIINKYIYNNKANQ